MDGIDILKVAQRDNPSVPVVIISGHGNIEIAVAAIKQGAYDFIEKPKIEEGIINGGFFVFKKSIFDYLSSDEHCDFEVGPLEQLTQDGQLMVYHHKGDWACMDTYRDSIFLNDLWKNGKAFWNA